MHGVCCGRSQHEWGHALPGATRISPTGRMAMVAATLAKAACTALEGLLSGGLRMRGSRGHREVPDTPYVRCRDAFEQASRVSYSLVNARDSSWHRVDQHLPALVSRCYRLLLMIGCPRSGKTMALRRRTEGRDWSLVNVTFPLSERHLGFAQEHCPLAVERILDKVVSEQRAVRKTEFSNHKESE